MLITNSKVYDTLKWIAMVLIPAVGTLYFALAGIWNLGYGTSVVGSLTALDTFLGIVLHLSSQAYSNSDAAYDGTVNVTQTATSKSFSLNLNGDPNDLDKKDAVTFKVNAAATPPEPVTVSPPAGSTA